jgi:hypothetical protein
VRWCYPKRTNKCGARGVAEKDMMSNTRVIFKNGGRVHVGRITSVGGNMAGSRGGYSTASARARKKPADVGGDCTRGRSKLVSRDGILWSF